MKQNNIPLLFASFSSATTSIFTQTIVTAVIMAFVGAVIGWVTTQVLNYCKRKILTRKALKNVPK